MFMGSELVLFVVLLITSATNSKAHVTKDLSEELWEHFEVYYENIPKGEERPHVPPRAWRRKRRNSKGR